MNYYVYHLINPITESVFYVGKGKISRLDDYKDSRRNPIHNRISKKYGIQRKIIFEIDKTVPISNCE